MLMYSARYLFLLLSFLVVAQSCSNEQNEMSSGENAEYAQSAEQVSPVLTGTQIPDVTVRNSEGKQISLNSLIQEKPTVLIFYRGGWCPYCSQHMAELQQIEDEIVDIGYQIIAVSPDQPEYLRESREEYDLSYSLYSDSPMTASKAFGIAFQVYDETYRQYKENDMDFVERSGYDHKLLPVPAVFLVNPDGMVTFQYVNPDYKTRINGDVLLTAAEAYFPESNTD